MPSRAPPMASTDVLKTLQRSRIELLKSTNMKVNIISTPFQSDAGRSLASRVARAHERPPNEFCYNPNTDCPQGFEVSWLEMWINICDSTARTKGKVFVIFRSDGQGKFGCDEKGPRSLDGEAQPGEIDYALKVGCEIEYMDSSPPLATLNSPASSSSTRMRAETTRELITVSSPSSSIEQDIMCRLRLETSPLRPEPVELPESPTSQQRVVQFESRPVMTITMDGAYASFNKDSFKVELAKRLAMPDATFKVYLRERDRREIQSSTGFSIFVVVDEEGYMTHESSSESASSSGSEGSSASDEVDDELAKDSISVAIRHALRQQKIQAPGESVTVKWDHEGSIVVCVELEFSLALTLIERVSKRDPELVAAPPKGLGVRSCFFGEHRGQSKDKAVSHSNQPSVKDISAFHPSIAMIVFAPDHLSALGLAMPPDTQIDFRRSVNQAYRKKSRTVHPDKMRIEGTSSTYFAAAEPQQSELLCLEDEQEAKLSNELLASTVEIASPSPHESAAQPVPVSEEISIAQTEAEVQDAIERAQEAERDVAAALSRINHAQLQPGCYPAFHRLTEARDVLTDPTRCEQYLRELRSGRIKGPTLDERWVADALQQLHELEHMQVLQFVEKQAHERAEKARKQAVVAHEQDKAPPPEDDCTLLATVLARLEGSANAQDRQAASCFAMLATFRQGDKIPLDLACKFWEGLNGQHLLGHDWSFTRMAESLDSEKVLKLETEPHGRFLSMSNAYREYIVHRHERMLPGWHAMLLQCCCPAKVGVLGECDDYWSDLQGRKRFLHHWTAAVSSDDDLSKRTSRLDHLESLDLGNTELTSLPSKIGLLVALQRLSLWSCPLTSLPCQICQLPCLKTLILSSCENLKALPPDIGQLNVLAELDLGRCCQLEVLPPDIGNLGSLVTLNLECCTALQSLPKGIGQLTSLATLIISNCSQLTYVPPELGQLQVLQKLDAQGCTSLASLPCEIGMLHELKELTLSFCSSLVSLPKEIGELHKLENLALYRCDNLCALPTELGNLHSLKELNLKGCLKLASLPTKLEQLDWLNIMRPKHLD